MSFSSLTIGASSLYAAQRAADIAAHNIANANTPGFTKQRLEITNAVPTPGTPGVRGDGMRGNGVAVVSISRLRDVLADLSYRTEAGTSAAADARSAVMSRAEVALGQFPDGASKDLDAFFTAWTALANTPQDPAARTNVLDTGRQVASSLGSAAAQLDQLTSDTGAQLRDSVDEVNGLAAHVAALNQSIADAVTAGEAPNDLLDQRDVALDRLAALTGGTIRAGSSSQVDVYVGNSALVVGVGTRPMTATQNGSTWGVAVSGNPVVVGGELGANARALSVDLPEFGRRLDEVAASLAEKVNALHSTAYSLDSPDPATAPDGGDFFTGTTARTLQVRPDLTWRGVAVSAAGAKPDGSVGLAISALSTSGDPSVGDLLRGAASQMGAAAATALRDAASAHSGLSGADQRRSASDGVNIDEEMVDLVKYQRSYEAAARVISTADGFFDTIINRMGAGR